MCSDWAHSLIPLLIPSVKLNKSSDFKEKSWAKCWGGRSLKPQWHCPLQWQRAVFQGRTEVYIPFFAFTSQNSPTKAHHGQEALSLPSSAISLQRERKASRQDPEQKFLSAQGSANNALRHSATERDGPEGFLEQTLQWRVHKRPRHTTMLYTWAIASKTTHKATHAISSRYKEMPNAHHW